MSVGKTKAILGKISAILLVSVFLRVVWALCVPMRPVSDSLAYRTFADSIASGLGYAYSSGELTVFWPVGTSAFYALLIKVFGSTNFPTIAANVAVGTGIVYFTYVLAVRYFSVRIAIGAAWLVACWPVLIQFTTVYASEQLFTLLLLAALYFWGISSVSWIIRTVFWGALMCAATYVRPTALPLFLLLPALHYWGTRDLGGALRSALVATLTGAILFAPWVLRNQQVFGKPVLVSANFGSNFWMGNNPDSKGDYMPLPQLKFENEVVRDQYFKQQAFDYVKSHPGEYLKLSMRRFFLTYDRETIGVAWNEPALTQLWGSKVLVYLKLLSSLYWGLLAIAAALGVGWALWIQRIGAINPLMVVSAFFFVIPILTVGQDRYHMPLIPFVAMYAAFAFQAGLKYFHTRMKR